MSVMERMLVMRRSQTCVHTQVRVRSSGTKIGSAWKSLNLSNLPNLQSSGRGLTVLLFNKFCNLGGYLRRIAVDEHASQSWSCRSLLRTWAADVVAISDQMRLTLPQQTASDHHQYAQSPAQSIWISPEMSAHRQDGAPVSFSNIHFNSWRSGTCCWIRATRFA
jgi:hypothetical protein